METKYKGTGKGFNHLKTIEKRILKLNSENIEYIQKLRNRSDFNIKEEFEAYALMSELLAELSKY